MNCFQLSATYCSADYKAIDSGVACTQVVSRNTMFQLRPQKEWNALDGACKADLLAALARLGANKRAMVDRQRR